MQQPVEKSWPEKKQIIVQCLQDFFKEKFILSPVPSREGNIQFSHNSFPYGAISLTCNNIIDAVPLINKTGAFLKLFEESELVRQHYDRQLGWTIYINPVRGENSFLGLCLSSMGSAKRLRCNLDACCSLDDNGDFLFTAQPISQEIDALLAIMQSEAEARIRAASLPSELQAFNLSQLEDSMSQYRDISQQMGRIVSPAVIGRQVSDQLAGPELPIASAPPASPYFPGLFQPEVSDREDDFQGPVLDEDESDSIVEQQPASAAQP